MRQRSSYGWLELIVGILLTVLGIYSFFRPVDYLTTLIVVYGVAAFVTGIIPATMGTSTPFLSSRYIKL